MNTSMEVLKMTNNTNDDLIKTISKIRSEEFPNLTDDIINQIILIERESSITSTSSMKRSKIEELIENNYNLLKNYYKGDTNV